MTSNNPRTIERNIKRIKREISALEEFFYGAHEFSDRFLYADMLEHKRDNFVRGAILQLHTAIEDLLSNLIFDALLGIKPRQMKRRSRARKSRRGHTVADLLDGVGALGFAQKTRLSAALGIIDKRMELRLATINTLRNKCSHNWLLNTRIRRNKRPSQQKPPLLAYKGRSLHGLPAFEEFTQEYGRVYLRLYARYTGTRF